jgi:hypothetical protein
LALDLIKNELKSDLFLNQNDRQCITCNNGKTVTTYKVRSKLFKQFLNTYLRSKGLKFNENALEELISEIEFSCSESKITKEVFTRIGYDYLNNVLVDNSDEINSFIQINREGFCFCDFVVEKI